MGNLRRIWYAIGLEATLVGTSGGLASPAAQAALAPPAATPAQFFGPPVWPGGFSFGPDLTSPYAGSPGYPYYRYGAYYGSANGFPYPVYPSYGAYYGGAAGTAYPSYSSAGGVVFGDSWGSGYYPG